MFFKQNCFLVSYVEVVARREATFECESVMMQLLQDISDGLASDEAVAALMKQLLLSSDVADVGTR